MFANYSRNLTAKWTQNRTFTRLLSLTNKIHPWFRAKQWHILPEPPKAAKAEYSYCFARKHGWILFVRDKSRVNVILAILNIRNYKVLNANSSIKHEVGGQIYIPMFAKHGKIDYSAHLMFYWDLVLVCPCPTSAKIIRVLKIKLQAFYSSDR